MKLPLYQLDAFTSRLFGGNPAAVVLLDAWLPDGVPPVIAGLHNAAIMHALCILPGGDVMSQTLTIRNVPDSLARKLKTRAGRNHRSLQGEVMAILVQASAASTAEQTAAPYRASLTESGAKTTASETAPQPAAGAPGKKLTIEEIWERGKRLGLSGPNESARIVRKVRDERFGR
jgi:plasmid stability protein